MKLTRDVKLDPNWLEEAVREFDEEMAKKPPYTGYSPFRDHERKPRNI